MSYTFAGKDDQLNGGAVTPTDAIGGDQCFSKYSQLYIEQGTYIVDPASGMTSMGMRASVDACAAECGDSCQYFSFVYGSDTRAESSGTCYIRNRSVGGQLAARKLFFKMIPTQDMSGQSVLGRSVSTGVYTQWSTVVNEAEQGFDVSNPPSLASSLEACLAACDNDASCLLVYYDATAATRKCVLKTGAPAPRIRTAVQGLAGALIRPVGGNDADRISAEYTGEDMLSYLSDHWACTAEYSFNRGSTAPTCASPGQGIMC
jgi:hypothetical protein